MRFLKALFLIAGLLPVLSSGAAIGENFEIFNDCSPSCIISPKPGVKVNTSLPLRISPSPQDEGLLYYSMFIQDRFNTSSVNDIATIEVGNFAKIKANAAYSEKTPLGTIDIELVTASGVKKFTHKRRSEWFTLNWTVPVGEESPTSIKLFINQIDDLRRIIEPPIIYSIELDNESLANWPRTGKMAFSVANPSQDIVISWPSVRYGDAPMQHHRQKRWSEWHTGLLLCWAQPFNAIYNYVTQNRCELSNTWEGALYKLVAGTPQTTTMGTMNSTPIEHRIHFSKDNALGALAAHRVCGISLESLARSRQPRGWEELSACGFRVENIVSLYIATRLSFANFRSVVDDLLNGRVVESQEPEAVELLRSEVRESPGLVLEGLADAEARLNNYRANNPGSSAEDAQTADVLSLTCPADREPCDAPSTSGVLVNQEYPPGEMFLAEGEPVEFTPNGTLHWNENRLLATHQRLLDQGFVFAGFHGTSPEAANGIVRGGIQHREQESLLPFWPGFYVSGDPSVAHGYALTANGRGRGTMLRVYVPRASLSRLFRIALPLDDPQAVSRIGNLIGRPLPLDYDSITGPQTEGEPDETILGWRLALHAIAIPSMILGNDGMGGDPSMPDYEANISELPNYVTESKQEL
ncbi:MULTISPECIES: exotoxin A binding domain-containing protein [unclassified Serratia (in: enterobacteria)]|uniref:exotoxin A binding domain-containing protein n=1 Tax=unclassified Serratia (in: enterobacteria) TaxID=2647522 RepID=UPI003076823F